MNFTINSIFRLIKFTIYSIEAVEFMILHKSRYSVQCIKKSRLHTVNGVITHITLS